ncbi:star-related lipid transfer protein 7 mitochondrial [Phtheirospermum japonicum]|uniref:Star-related lipid transfer protein 7 mitochondrial n=1 Tax=Phtheirospermum japonicum TaxID=374723 RepID=A0A830CDL2_9LAMI|nr:star-related lipid transfer protein 7 mitochondrial [Phtheirospermum japonicum]
MAPIWIAVVVGVLVGWAWKPKWADNPNVDFLDRYKGVLKNSVPSFSSLKLQLPTCVSWISDLGSENDISSFTSSKLGNEKSSLVNEDDLRHLHKLAEEKDGGRAWIEMMERSTLDMSYRAWRRDPETGPPQYRSRTVYEDATPEMLRDFFWDDEFRLKWDDMLIHAETLNDCPTTGTMVVRWVRKFPFFCSDREYIIGRRIWDSGRTYYCITKGVPCSSVPRRNKPRRVDLYYSSWCIRSAESKRDGRLTACEVLLFHHEDMGIPWEIAKLGIRQGMWGAVKKIDPGLRAYQKHRATGAPLSCSALMAQINTKFSVNSLESQENSSSVLDVEPLGSEDKPSGKGIRKLLVVGGAVALAYSLDQGLLTKAFIYGVARRFASMGRKL